MNAFETPNESFRVGIQGAITVQSLIEVFFDRGVNGIQRGEKPGARCQPGHEARWSKMPKTDD